MSQNPIERLRTIRDLIRYAITRFNKAELFFGHGTDNALDEATAAVLHVLSLPHDLPAHFMDAVVTDEEKDEALLLIHRRATERRPLAYLTNEAWFCGLKFFVDERVLIPRSPIGELVESGFSPWVQADEVNSVLDMCTGSGCIAIACAYAFPEARVDAVDISDAALTITKRNVKSHKLEQTVAVVKSDLFQQLDATQRYDLIVTNPPYVDQLEIGAMPAEFRFEPRLGLESGADGLDAISEILKRSAEFLTENGVLIAEVGVSDVALEEKYPDVPFTWLEMEHGGTGVFVLTRQQLTEFGSYF